MSKDADCLDCIYYKNINSKYCYTCVSAYKAINEDEPIKVKQLIFSFSYKYGYRFEFKENIIELYSDEFKFYQTKEDIEIDDGVDIYKLVSEVFVSIDSSDELIKQIKIQVKESMEEWFKKRINELMHGL